MALQSVINVKERINEEKADSWNKSGLRISEERADYKRNAD
jgi:hypothetical protein